MNEIAMFLGQMIRQPAQISGVVPSSRYLARAMAQGIGPQTGKVLEFGAGTGRLTRAILERGVAPSDLQLFELNPVFCRRLSLEFSGVTITHGPAQEALKLPAGSVGAVVSGLPMLSIPRLIQSQIVAAAFHALRADGELIQFTYGTKAPIDPQVCESLGIKAHKGAYVIRNMPPARIYHYRRG